MKSRGVFGVIDYLVFFATIVISFGIGIVFAVLGRKKNTTVDYFLAGRSAKTWPVVLSFIVTFQSSLMVLGFPAEGYVYGVGLAYYAVGSLTAFIFSALLIVPLFHPLKLTSVYEYFNLRYGDNILRYVTLAAGITYSLFYMASVTVGTCIALEVVMGIPFWGTIIIYTTVTTIYTSVGGFRAVIWTDVFQLIIMLTGILSVLIKTTTDAGGASNVFRYAKERMDIFDFRIDPTIRYQFWNASFGTFSIMVYTAYMQPAMQRVYATPSVRTARNVYVFSAPLYSLFQVLAAVQGATIFAYYVAKRCDIFEFGVVQNVNEILPFTVLELFRHQPGLPGLFIASLSSAALSTLSSCLNSLSAVTFEDVIKVKFPSMPPYKATKLSKIVVLVYGLIAMGLAFAIARVPGSVISVFTSLMGCMDGPVTAAFFLSAMSRRVTTKGLCIGAACGMAVTLWLNMGSQFSGVPPYPYMPAGPVDHCYVFQDDVNTTVGVTSIYNSFSNNVTYQLYNSDMTTSTITSLENPQEKTFLDKVYSISYILFSLTGLITSLTVGFLASLCTTPPKTIDERCIFSFKKHFVDELFRRPYKEEKECSKEQKMEELVKFMSKNEEL